MIRQYPNEASRYRDRQNYDQPHDAKAINGQNLLEQTIGKHFGFLLVQQVIMFSETRVGLYSAHIVANRPSDLVAKNVTKSVTKSVTYL